MAKRNRRAEFTLKLTKEGLGLRNRVVRQGRATHDETVPHPYASPPPKVASCALRRADSRLRRAFRNSNASGTGSACTLARTAW